MSTTCVETAKVDNALILSDCPVNIECIMVDSIVTDSREMFIRMFMEILNL